MNHPHFLEKTLTGLLRENAASDPAAVAVQWGEQVLTHAELDVQSDRVAAGLARCGIGKGDVVSCQLPNIPEFLILHHAVAKRRAIFNPIHMAYRSAEVAHILSFAESVLFVAGPDVRGFSYARMALQLQPQLPALRRVVSLADGVEGIVPFRALLQEGEGAAPALENPRPEDPFLMLFTSGTTASPKATVHTHNMRMSNSWFCGRDMALGKDDRMLCCSQFSHMWGILNYWSSVIYGCRQVLLERYRPEAFLPTAERGRATVVIGAPVHAVDLLAAPDLNPDALAAMRLFALSGSVCPPVLVARLRHALPNCVPVVFWGMTETGGGCYTRLDDPPEVIENTTGRASGPCVLAVLDGRGSPLPVGEKGELAIRSPFGIQSYFNNPAATAESFTRDGWFLTGDLARIDASGNIQILGRGKEEINRGGTKFSPDGVEQVILRHPAVQLAALVGVPDERLGERSVCFLVARAGLSPPTLPQLCALLEQNGIAKFKWPERLEVVDGLPLTPTGKIQRALLRERFGSVGQGQECGPPKWVAEPRPAGGSEET